MLSCSWLVILCVVAPDSEAPAEVGGPAGGAIFPMVEFCSTEFDTGDVIAGGGASGWLGSWLIGTLVFAGTVFAGA